MPYEPIGGGHRATKGDLAYPLAIHGKWGSDPKDHFARKDGRHGPGKLWQNNNALDIKVPVGTPVIAVADGVIGLKIGHTNATDPKLSGLRITLITASNKFYYQHLSEYAQGIGPNVHVKKGQIIGYSGIGDGVPHLHFAAEHGDVSNSLSNTDAAYVPQHTHQTPGESNLHPNTAGGSPELPILVGAYGGGDSTQGHDAVHNDSPDQTALDPIVIEATTELPVHVGAYDGPEHADPDTGPTVPGDGVTEDGDTWVQGFNAQDNNPGLAVHVGAYGGGHSGQDHGDGSSNGPGSTDHSAHVQDHVNMTDGVTGLAVHADAYGGGHSDQTHGDGSSNGPGSTDHSAHVQDHVNMTDGVTGLAVHADAYGGGHSDQTHGDGSSNGPGSTDHSAHVQDHVNMTDGVTGLAVHADAYGGGHSDQTHGDGSSNGPGSTDHSAHVQDHANAVDAGPAVGGF